MSARRQSRRGLTLIEVVVVIAILSLLTAAIAVNAMSIYVSSRRKAAVLELRNIEQGLDAYALKKSRYPDPAVGLQALVDEGVIKELPVDPWGHEYDYRLEKGEPKVSSYGADGVPGGEGDDADVFPNRQRAEAMK